MTRRYLSAVLMMAMGAILISGGTRLAHAAPALQQAEASPDQVNLNTATEAELEALPGIGPAIAARIVEYREANGRFQKVEDLMNVRGIGERSFLRLRPMITVTAAGAEGGSDR